MLYQLGWTRLCCEYVVSLDSIVIVLIIKGVKYLTSRYNVSGIAPHSGWVYFRTDIPPKKNYSLIVEVDQKPSDNVADCDVYMNLGAYPTHTRYIYRDVTLDNYIRLVAMNASAGSWFVGIFGFAECQFSIKATITKSPCPDDCNGNGQCVNGICVCNPGWFGNSCNSEVKSLTPGTPVTDDLTSRNFKYYKINLDTRVSSLKYVLEELTSGDDVDLDIYAKHGNIPSTSDWDYANASLTQITELKIPNAKAGTWYAGVHAYKCEALSCRFRIKATIDRTCANQCSRRGRCSQTTCNCNMGYSGDYCETKSTVVEYGMRYEGYVEEMTWNYFPFVTNTMNPVAVYIRELNIRGGDCDLYIKRGMNKPTLFDYDYQEISPDSTVHITILSPGSDNWWIGVYGYKTCDYTVQVAYANDIVDCKNGGTRPGPNEPCRCPNGFTGLLCEYPVTMITSGQVKEGTLERNDWKYFKLHLTRFPSDVVIYVKEENSSEVGNIWLFASIGDVPTVAEHDYEDIDANTNYHIIRITREQIPTPGRPADIIVGVHTSPNTLRPANDFKLTVWHTPIEF